MSYQLLSVFELFKQKVVEIRKNVEEFKDSHKMASEAISTVIKSLPPPFDKFAGVIWNGLEKQGEGGAADSSAKLLEILEKIENNTEQSFYEIQANISELIQFGAKTEDIQNLGEQIRISNESVIQTLKQAFNEELKKASQRIEESFESSLTDLRLLESNLSLVTIMTEFGNGSRDCWKEGYFRDEDIKSGYDVRRPITDNIIASLENNIGTIVYGKPYYGKSTILKRIMFELIDKGYAVVFSDGIRASDPKLLIQLLNRLTGRFPKILVIADNVHRRGSDAFFVTFNYFARQDKSEKIIKFLFGAREEEFKTAKEGLEREKAAEIDVALRRIHQVRIDFSFEDAILFLKKANAVSDQKEMSEQEIKIMSDIGYKATGGDPFMFILGLMAYVSGKDTAPRMDFLSRDLNEKIGSLAEDERLLKAALLCSFMGMFGIPLITGVLESNRIHRNHLKLLAEKGILFQNGEYKTRHELWMLEFLNHIYSKDFDNDFVSFDTMYNIKGMISSILNNIDLNYLLNILTRCALLYRNKRFNPITKVIVDNYFVPDHLNSSKQAKLYCFGLGGFYSYIEDYPFSIEYFDKAINLDPNVADAWNNKGFALDKLGKYEEAARCYDKALDINPNHALAWNNKGSFLRRLGNDEEAEKCYDKALEINPNQSLALHNKGKIFLDSGKYEEAIRCFDKALESDSIYVSAWVGRGVAFHKLGNREEAARCYDKALEINPNDANAWINKGAVLEESGQRTKAIECYDRALELDPNNAVAHCNKGNALSRLGEYMKAVESYDKALELDSKYVVAWYNKGAALSNEGKYEEAIKCYDKAIELDPRYADDSKAWYNRGLAFYGLKQYTTAIECYDKAIELDPKYVDAWGNRGLALHKLGKYNEAIGCYDKVIGINPVLSRAWYNKARSKVKEGFIEEGLKDLKTSIKIDKGLIELSKKEKDFQGIINDEQFKEITQGFT